jgi:hypothetical protein
MMLGGERAENAPPKAHSLVYYIIFIHLHMDENHDSLFFSLPL